MRQICEITCQYMMQVRAEDQEKEASLKKALDTAVNDEQAKVSEMKSDMDKVCEYLCVCIYIY